jgi:hypothetical protein
VNAWDEIEGRSMQAFCRRTLWEVVDEMLVEPWYNCRMHVRKLSSLIDWLNEQIRRSRSHRRGSDALRYQAHKGESCLRWTGVAPYKVEDDDLLANTKCIARRPG